MTFDANAQSLSYFSAGNIVISTVSNQLGTSAAAGANSGGNGLDTASPITLTELTAGTTTNGATIIGSLVLPQTTVGSNVAISGEYGSASEGILQQSVDGKLLPVMGCGVTANAFNNALSTAISNGYTVNTANPAIPVAQDAYGTSALGQTTSLTADLANGVNNARIGAFVYLSPEQFFYASATVLYIADSGSPKNGSVNTAALGEGGLQKWIYTGTYDASTNTYSGGYWQIAYDLYQGLSLVNNATAGTGANTSGGVTGLFGLACQVVGASVQCYATSYGLNELSLSHVYEISDTLAYTTYTQASSESFVTVYTAPDTTTNTRGVAFAPVPEPMTLVLFGTALAGLGAVVRGRRKG